MVSLHERASARRSLREQLAAALGLSLTAISGAGLLSCGAPQHGGSGSADAGASTSADEGASSEGGSDTGDGGDESSTDASGSGESGADDDTSSASSQDTRASEDGGDDVSGSMSDSGDEVESCLNVRWLDETCSGCAVAASMFGLKEACEAATMPYRTCNYVCFDGPPEGETCESFYSEECALSAYICGVLTGGKEIVDGPAPPKREWITEGYADDDACCYLISGDCAVGRPLLIDGLAHTARLVAGAEGWRAPPSLDGVSLQSLGPEARKRLAEYWRAEALSEHAAVAAFNRYSLQLLALGAPCELVLAAQHAAADEVRHAQVAFGLAQHMDGRVFAPSPLDVAHALDGQLDLLAFVRALVSEGCVAETISLAILGQACAQVRDPVVAAALTQVYKEEQAHVELAWRSLAWALRQASPEMRVKLERELRVVLDEAEQYIGFGHVVPGDEAELSGYGYVARQERERIAATHIVDTVRPLAMAILADPGACRLTEPESTWRGLY